DLVKAWRDVAIKANAIIPHQVYGQPDKSDAYALADDLEAMWRIFDPLIEAYGEYVQSNFGISEHDVIDCFRDQLRGALEGNATFILTSAGDDIEQSRLDTEADYEIDRRRDERAA